jgi:uncharacterized protein
MIVRKMTSLVHLRLGQMPCVVLLGPRQVGKTTLAMSIQNELGSKAIYLDLENRADRVRIAEPESYLAMHQDKLVILDEIHRAPELFSILRGQIDERRRMGRPTGHFLILGSAAIELMRQSSESLAGRSVQLEMTPVQPTEISSSNIPLNIAWERGGFPDSLLATDTETSLIWRKAFIRTYLERDIPQFGFRISADTLYRFWTMLAHTQGGILNTQRLAQSLDANWHTVNQYLGLLTDLLLIRQLRPWSANLGKRLVKSPKVYVRDSGLLHSLLGINSIEELLGHPAAGESWEGFVIEALIAAAPEGTRSYYYRTQAGAEIDLVLEFSFSERWAIEIKKSSVPTISKGYQSGVNDISATRKIVIHQGAESFPMKDGVEALTLGDALNALSRLLVR